MNECCSIDDSLHLPHGTTSSSRPMSTLSGTVQSDLIECLPGRASNSVTRSAQSAHQHWRDQCRTRVLCCASVCSSAWPRADILATRSPVTRFAALSDQTYSSSCSSSSSASGGCHFVVGLINLIISFCPLFILISTRCQRATKGFKSVQIVWRTSSRRKTKRATHERHRDEARTL